MRSTGSAVLPTVGALIALAVCASASAAQRPTLTSDLPADGFIAATRAITIRAASPLGGGTGRIAVFIDDTDVSALVQPTADGWRYDARLLPLSSGEHELIAWIVEGDSAWHEALRAPFRVPGALGIEAAGAKPTLDLGVKARLASAFEPAVVGERDTYNDLDGRLGLDAEVVRHGGLRFSSRAQLVGNSERNRALRFSELAEEAPRIDLASYVAQVSHGGLELSAGNIVAGDARHLIQGFNSRGASVALGASRLQLSASALHGSNLVGWSDLVGLGLPDHRLLTGSIGLETLREPGALRFEFTALDGSVLPRSGFDRGAVTDAETSTGYALRVRGQALDRRLRLEGGFTRSRFDNPEDPMLARDTTLVPVDAETRDAHFIETSLDVLRGLRLGGTRAARITVGWAHERVDPLFRTVGAYTRADQLQNRWELRGDIAGITVAASHDRSHNNLDALASILTSHTRRSGLDVSLPVPTVVSGPDWLPRLRWRADRTHQFGVGVPENGGFSESHVPDQVSTSHTVAADVRIGFAALGYRWDLAAQDNRQVGRENADLERTTHGFSAVVDPLRTVSANIDLSWVAASSTERNETGRTRRIGLSVNWSPLREAVLGMQLADTHQQDDGSGGEQDDRSWSVQWASPVPGLRRFGGRLLLRFARAENAASASLGTPLRRANWIVDAGFNLSFR